MSDWTQEQREEVVATYEAAVEGLEDIAAYDAGRAAITEMSENLGKTPVAVQTIVSRAGKYIKKPAGAGGATATASTGTTRVSKADAIAELTQLIEGIDAELVDEAILSKLTGKAAQYFASILKTATN